MSFDIHFQRFVNGDAGYGGGDEVRRVLGPYLRPSADNPERIDHPGGSAEIHGLDDSSMMVTHVDGDEAIWDVLVQAAVAGEWTIMPIGCPACVFSSAMLASLPVGLDEDAVVIDSGSQLLTLIRES
ncbi:hypothetical protein WDJ51_15315 [Rathayibacter sp. YIM 133350]|uniref:hypothetical protein n=1 Tax=Rathayibacter sp. YIM 133350 TaxID=3131992 RepID=UPI00307ED06B